MFPRRTTEWVPEIRIMFSEKGTPTPPTFGIMYNQAHTLQLARLLALDVFVEPCNMTVQPVHRVLRLPDPVGLPRVADELRWDVVRSLYSCGTAVWVASWDGRAGRQVIDGSEG